MNETFLEQKWLETKNGKICYFLNNKFENRPTVVFLHGLSANHTTWDRPMKSLKKLKVNSLAPDLRGHGYSDKTRESELYKYPVITGDLEAMLEKEKLEKIILVGYSFGGFIALDYVRRNPDKVLALVLISANHVNPWKYKNIRFLTRPAYWTLRLLAWLFSWQGRRKYYYYDQEKDLGYWRSTLKGYLTMPLSVNFWLLSEAANLDFSADIEKINCPTLIVKSKADMFLLDTEANDMVRKIKSSELIVMDEPSHFLASRYQNKIIEAIINFLGNKKLI